MKIKFNDNELEMHYSQRIYMMFEEIQGKSLNLENLTAFDVNTLFYVCVLSTMQYNHIEDKLSFTDFLNWIDDNGNDVLVAEFANWFVSILQQQADLVNKKDLKDDDTETDKKELPKNF